MAQDKFKIGYFADGPWSHQAFELLILNPEIEIKFIVPRADTNDETLFNFSQRYGIDYLHPVNINTKEFLEDAKSYNCDLFVSMSFNQIFKDHIINLPRHKTINCHAGKLPFYRGRNILNWALINDEDEFGITVHYVDSGIDTGDIILQESYSISDNDDYSTLLELATEECAKLLYKAIILIMKGSASRTPQKSLHPVGFYCGRRTCGDETINWNQNSREIFNFIRAICSPGPKATTYFKGKEIKINRAKMIEDAPIYINTPGQLLCKTPKGFLIKTKDSFVEIFEIETKVKLRVGDKLGV